jgi:hypothetical protein
MATTAEKYTSNYYEWQTVEGSGGYNIFVYWAGVAVAQQFFPNPDGFTPAPTEITSSFGTFYRGTLQTGYSPSFDTSVGIHAVSRLIPLSAPTQGSTVFGADYNAVQTKAAGILGTGAAYGGPTNGYGYGQPVVSSAVNPTDLITKTQWNNLVNDLNKINQHQRGAVMVESANISNDILANPISFENLQLLDDTASWSITQRFNAHFTNSTQSNIHEGYVPYEWGGVGEPQAVSSAVTLTWASLNDMHYWFNMGGRYSVIGRTNGAPVGAQETAWATLMGDLSANFTASQLATAIAAGGAEIVLDADTGAASPYDLSIARIYARVTSPGNGTVQLRLRVYYEDNHSPVPLGVDGIRAFWIGYRVTERKITGAANGAFDAPSNTLSIEFF